MKFAGLAIAMTSNRISNKIHKNGSTVIQIKLKGRCGLRVREVNFSHGGVRFVHTVSDTRTCLPVL